jgi:ATP-dependent helicase/DNAse subunit B
VFVDALDSSSFRYKDFDHNFKYSPIFTNDKNMEISFSLIDDYLHCPFKYFVKRICGAQVFEDNFYSKLGTLLHNVLEDSLKKDVSKEDYQNEIRRADVRSA